MYWCGLEWIGVDRSRFGLIASGGSQWIAEGCNGLEWIGVDWIELGWVDWRGLE